MDQIVTFPAPLAVEQRADADLLLRRFREACLKGESRFAKGEITEESLKLLPKPLKGWWKPAAGVTKVFRLTATRPVYLVTFKAETEQKGNKYNAYCAMAIEGVRLRTAWDNINGQVYADDAATQAARRQPMSAVIQPKPEEGYIFTGNEIGYGYTVLQISSLNSQQRVRAQAEIDRVKKQFAKVPR